MHTLSQMKMHLDRVYTLSIIMHCTLSVCLYVEFVDITCCYDILNEELGKVNSDFNTRIGIHVIVLYMPGICLG